MIFTISIYRSGNPYSCCGNKTYDIKSHYCSKRNKIRVKPANIDFYQCNDVPYDDKTELCCWNDNYKIIKRIDETATTTTRRSKKNRKTEPYNSYLMGDYYYPYDPVYYRRRQGCCKGKAYFEDNN